MKIKLFRIGLFLSLGLTTAVLFSCDKDDESSETTKTVSEIKATNVKNGNEKIVTVKGLGYVHQNSDDLSLDYLEIAKSDYVNNGFTLKLPEYVDAEYLREISEIVSEEIVLSDNKAKVIYIDYINGFNEDDVEIGMFYCENDNDETKYYLNWMYSDRDLTVEGEFTETYIDKGVVEKGDTIFH